MALLMLVLTSPFSVQPAADPAVVGQGSSTAELAYIQSEEAFSYETVNDVSLYDTEADLIASHGQPLRLQEDRLLGSTEYIYNDILVGINNGIVCYVRVNKDAAYLKVNNDYMEMTPESIKEALGEPDFVADDGEVYIRDHHAIKVYLNPDNGKLQHVEFFDDFTS